MLLLLSGCRSTSTIHIEKNYDLAGINEIDYDELIAMRQEDQPFVLLIGRPSCQDCREFFPIVTSYLEENPGMYIYYFNIQDYYDKAQLDDAQDHVTFDSLKADFEFDWVPTMELISDGEIVSQYAYLSREYYQLEDLDEREAQKEESVLEFQDWIQDIFSEV